MTLVLESDCAADFVRIDLDYRKTKYYALASYISKIP